jgi:hypothetical protein
MAHEKHEVHLKEEERKKLLAIISKGRNKAVVIQRTHILLKVDEGKADAEISQMLYVSEQTIRRTRLRFAEAGLQAALEDKPHPAQGSELGEKEEAHISDGQDLGDVIVPRPARSTHIPSQPSPERGKVGREFFSSVCLDQPPKIGDLAVKIASICYARPTTEQESHQYLHHLFRDSIGGAIDGPGWNREVKWAGDRT